ncbi:MAG: penicillin-insensitive murein endopeptidase [Stackebrandtia sp.]
MNRRRALWSLPVVILAAVMAWTLIPTAAGAFPNAYFHMQALGNRGVDVLAAQHLLVQAGHQVEPNGHFDAATETAVKAFQTEAGMDADGVVGPDTWTALAPDLKTGDENEAVKALQEQLNAKQQLSLEVNGKFDAAVEEAVRGFQDHAEIGGDGAVAEETWRNLVWHFQYPNADANNMCAQDPDGNGDAHWGTGSAVGQLQTATKSFGDNTDGGVVPLGDVSFEHGGPIDGHASHQEGLDADIWPIRTDREQCTGGRIEWTDDEYDQDATRKLAQAIHDAAGDKVVFILFNDPVLIEEGLTEEYANHDNHLHVRYCEFGHPNSSYAC